MNKQNITSSKNQNLKRNPKAGIKKKVVRITPRTTNSKSTNLGNEIIRNVEKAQNYYEKAIQKFTPFSTYVHMLLHENSPPMLTPLTPVRAFMKRVYYQDTLAVNSNGDLAIVIQPLLLGKMGSASLASPVLYMNQTAYDPDATTQAGLIGGWNTDIIGPAGLNQLYSAIESARVASMHVSIQLTGVSNLNKQGTLHIAEDTAEVGFLGIAADSTYNELLLDNFSIQRLPKAGKYKSVEIMNMDASSNIEYHYFPVTNANLARQYQNVTTFSSSSQDIQMMRRFALIIKSAATGTTARIRYEINLEQEINVDSINSYPPKYSRCFVDSEPTLQLISQNEDYVLRINSKEGHVTSQFYNEVALSKVLPSHDSAIVGVEGKTPLTKNIKFVTS